MLRARKATSIDVIDAGAAQEAKPGAPASDLDQAARAALAGDALALRRFLTRVAPIVRRVCRGVMGRENPDLEDAIQDSLLDLARALPQFRFEGSVAHYVAKIAMRRAIGSRRRAHARWQQEVAMEAGRPATPFDGGAAVRAELVRNLLDELNEEQAKALLLRIMVGHSIEEIASMTGVSVNTVKTRLRLAKNRLRGRLVRSGEGGR